MESGRLAGNAAYKPLPGLMRPCHDQRLMLHCVVSGRLVSVRARAPGIWAQASSASSDATHVKEKCRVRTLRYMHAGAIRAVRVTILSQSLDITHLHVPENLSEKGQAHRERQADHHAGRQRTWTGGVDGERKSSIAHLGLAIGWTWAWTWAQATHHRPEPWRASLIGNIQRGEAWGAQSPE